MYSNSISVCSFAEVEDKDSGHVTAGAKFCKALIGSYDQWILRKSDGDVTGDKLHVVTALKCLLAVAQSAKSAALECKWLSLKTPRKQTTKLLLQNFKKLSVQTMPC